LKNVDVSKELPLPEEDVPKINKNIPQVVEVFEVDTDPAETTIAHDEVGDDDYELPAPRGSFMGLRKKSILAVKYAIRDFYQSQVSTIAKKMLKKTNLRNKRRF